MSPTLTSWRFFSRCSTLLLAKFWFSRSSLFKAPLASITLLVLTCPPALLCSSRSLIIFSACLRFLASISSAFSWDFSSCFCTCWLYQSSPFCSWRLRVILWSTFCFKVSWSCSAALVCSVKRSIILLMSLSSSFIRSLALSTTASFIPNWCAIAKALLWPGIPILKR